MKVLGKDLKIGDTIKVWWSPNEDTIVSLKPYTGSLKHLFKDGAQLASFRLYRPGMTIDNACHYEKVEYESN